jgi:hypothetical protein
MARQGVISSNLHKWGKLTIKSSCILQKVTEEDIFVHEEGEDAGCIQDIESGFLKLSKAITKTCCNSTPVDAFSSPLPSPPDASSSPLPSPPDASSSSPPPSPPDDASSPLPSPELCNVPNLCAICLDSYQPDQVVAWSSGCTHAFHQDCIAYYLAKTMIGGESPCPSCRQKFCELPADEEACSILSFPISASMLHLYASS